MEWVEFTGRTVDEATEHALDQLGVAEGDAEVIVLTEPKTGLFGRVRGEARVRARVRPVGPRPKRTRKSRDRNGDGDRTRSGGRSSRTSGPAGATTDGAPDTVSDAAADGGRDADPPDPVRAASSTQPGDRTGSPGRSRSARRRRSRSGARGPGDGGQHTDPSSDDVDGRSGGTTAARNGRSAEEEIGMAEGMTLQEQAEVARGFLQELLAAYGFEASVDTRVVDEETVEIAASGSDLGLLVGPRGSTLAALQDVTRTVVQRQFPAKTDRILVDVAGYRERRAAALQRFSQQVATEVIETHLERALEPMSPADRKVVHDAVNDIDGVRTRSEGEDPGRYIVISTSD